MSKEHFIWLNGQRHKINNVEVVLRDANGVEKSRQSVKNLITTAGKGHVADQLASTPAQAAMGYMAIGTGSTAAAAGDTALQTELDRNALTSRLTSGAVVTYIGNWAAGDGTGAITEAGIFNAASNGTMLARVVFSVNNKGVADLLEIDWTLTVS